MLVLPIALLYVSLLIGRFPISAAEVNDLLLGRPSQDWSPSAATIVLQNVMLRLLTTLPPGKVRALEKLILDGQFPVGDQSYRAFAAAWTGHPTDKPAVAARVNPAEVLHYE